MLARVFGILTTSVRQLSSRLGPHPAPLPLVILQPSSRAGQDTVSFNPRTEDVVNKTYDVLYHGLKLPAEIVFRILENAQIWEVNKTHCHGETSGYPHVQSNDGLCPRFVRHNSVPVLAIPIEGALEYPLRRVIVRTTSRDQGWSSYPENWGTHDNSWTWFEITLEKEEDDGRWVEVVRRWLWSNVHASREFTVHVGSLGQEEDIVSMAKNGYRLCIWPVQNSQVGRMRSRMWICGCLQLVLRAIGANSYKDIVGE